MYYPWIKVNADHVSAFALSETSWAVHQEGAKVNLGFGAPYVLETTARRHGKSMLRRSARKTLQKKHQVGIWSGLQANIQPFEHPSSTPRNGREHWWVEQNFRTVLRDEKRAHSLTRSDTQEYLSWHEKIFWTHTWRRKVKAVPMAIYVLRKTVY